MKNLFLTAMAVFTAFTALAQDKKAEDVKAIKSMCGCYEVTFNFAETFSHSTDKDYKPSKTKTDYGLEWVALIEDQPNKLSLQHLLIVTDSMIVKHWRQDWEYQNNRFYPFFKDKTWHYTTLPAAAVKGQWTQRVFQVDDSPRYDGTATWVHVDGRHFWTNTADAPLPRREYTTRDDYNVLKRTNTHEITPSGWIHDQDNEKIKRDDNGKDIILAKEKGYDVYTKVPDSKCKAAQEYWAKYAPLWKNIREKWQTVYARNKNLNLQKTVDGKNIYDYLFDLKPNATKAESDKVIDLFVK